MSFPSSVAVPSMPNFTILGFVLTVRMKITLAWLLFRSFSSSLAPTSKVISPCGGFSLSLMALMLLMVTVTETSLMKADGKR